MRERQLLLHHHYRGRGRPRAHHDSPACPFEVGPLHRRCSRLGRGTDSGSSRLLLEQRRRSPFFLGPNHLAQPGHGVVPLDDRRQRAGGGVGGGSEVVLLGQDSLEDADLVCGILVWYQAIDASAPVDEVATFVAEQSLSHLLLGRERGSEPRSGTAPTLIEICMLTPPIEISCMP